MSQFENIEKPDKKQETKEILDYAIQEMLRHCPAELQEQLQQREEFSKMTMSLVLQSQGDNPVMGFWDVSVNEYITVDMTALLALLAGVLNETFIQCGAASHLTTIVSMGIFTASLLNSIQPAGSVKLEYIDAMLYCKMINLQKERPVNIPITNDEVQKCIQDIEEIHDLSVCLSHLQKKRLIKPVKGGFLIKREVKIIAL